MSLCDKRLVKLQERIANPLPAYSREQIQRTRKMQLETSAGEVIPEVAAAGVLPNAPRAETPACPHSATTPHRLQTCYSLIQEQSRPACASLMLLEKRSSPHHPSGGEHSSHSASDSPALPMRPQRNKLTNYFKPHGDQPLRPPPENFAALQFAQLGEGLNRRSAATLELMLHEREREAAELRHSLQELQGFKARAKKIAAEQALALENFRREELKQWLAMKRRLLGELVPVREGARFREVWMDGSELLRLKEELVRVQGEKEAAERRRRQIKRRSRVGEPCKEARLPTLPSFAELSDSNSFSLPVERQGEELRELLNAQIVYLAREENLLKQHIDEMEQAKEEFIVRAKHVHEEENCRFGRLVVSDAELKWPLLGGRYQLLGLLGKGGFSEVYKAFDVEELRLVACKVHQLAPHWSEQVKSNYIAHILREAKVHRALNHPNIVAQFDNVEIDLNSFCSVLEFCNGPDLACYLRRHKTLAEKDAKLIVKQIFNALRFLNENGRRVIHYDLKPQNILFHNGVAKVSDFGLCKVMDGNATRVELTSQGVGTYWYLPPECFQPASATISTKVDVWSAGVIYYEMLFGVKPFGQDCSQERIWKEGVMLRAHSLEFPAKPVVSLEAKDFLRKCLVYSQEERIDVLEACALLNR